MGWQATVETDTGERYRLLHPNGCPGGKVLLSFLTALSIFCLEGPSSNKDRNIEIMQWFQRLQESSSASLHYIGHPLVHAFYTGDWAYSADEFALFQARSFAMTMPEHEFQQTIRHIEEKWTATSLVQESVRILLTVLRESTPAATWWYDPEWSLLDMDALEQTLGLAETRGAEHVRIQFT